MLRAACSYPSYVLKPMEWYVSVSEVAFIILTGSIES